MLSNYDTYITHYYILCLCKCYTHNVHVSVNARLLGRSWYKTGTEASCRYLHQLFLFVRLYHRKQIK